MLEVKRLRLLWELSRRGTIAAVAEALNYSPSAVSQQLQQLEREIGSSLFRRVGRTLELTAAAEALADETETLLASLESAEASYFRALGEVSGTARIAVFQTAVLALMPQVLRRLRTEYPSLRVEMVQYEPETALRETWGRNFDLVIAEQYPNHAAPHFAGLDREPLTEDPITLAVPPNSAHVSDVDAPFQRVRTLVDAAELPWVMEPVGAASRHWAEQLCRQAGFEPDVRFETADLQAHVRLIESGNAVGLLPGLIQASRLRLVTLDGDPHRQIFTAARQSSAELPAVQTIRRVLTEVTADLL